MQQYDKHEDYELIEAIKDWHEEEGPDDFDIDFVEKMEVALERWGELTFNQRKGLTNIIESFDVPI